MSLYQELWEEVKPQDTKIKRSVFNQLNRSHFGIIQHGNIAYIECTPGYSIPNTVYDYVNKWLKNKGFNV